MENELIAAPRNFWAITTYYNPCKYKNRYENYHVFKERLSIPLITVELSYDGKFELTMADADILVQVSSSSVMWQKERLLNLALSHIPSNAKYVAWLDCDIFFENENWVEDTKRALEHFKIIQLFKEFKDLTPEAKKIREITQIPTTGYSIAYLVASNTSTLDDFRPTNTVKLRRALFGLAWASTVEFIKQSKFYDLMIIGAGDRALACAAFGRHEDAILATKLNEKRGRHYATWATGFFDNVRGKVGYLDGTLFHLYHGKISDRNYVERHKRFQIFNFDPNTDVKLAQNGTWQWVNRSEELNKFFLDYFESRKEDKI